MNMTAGNDLLTRFNGSIAFAIAIGEIGCVICQVHVHGC